MRDFSMKIKYDPECDSETWKGYKLGRLVNIKDPKRRAAVIGNNTAKLKQYQSKIEASKRPKREIKEAADQQLAETIRRAVAAIEFAMSEINEIGAVSGAQTKCNILSIHNGLFHLKTKCGVKFTQEEFDPYRKKVDLDRD